VVNLEENCHIGSTYFLIQSAHNYIGTVDQVFNGVVTRSISWERIISIDKHQVFSKLLEGNFMA
jgi:hypothetical protein